MLLSIFRRSRLRRAFAICSLLFGLSSICTAVSAEDVPTISPLQSLAEELTDKKKAVQRKAIAKLAATGDERVEKWLSALLEGELYKRKSDSQIVFGEKSGKLLLISDADTGEPIDTVKKRSVSKIKINNAIRTQLKGLLGTLKLRHPDATVRKKAASEMIGKLDAASLPGIQQLADTETNTDVKVQLDLMLSVYQLENGDSEQRSEALAVVDGKLHSPVINALRTISETDSDEAVRLQAQQQLSKAEGQLKWYSRLETLFFGVSLGSVLVVAAIGLAITFGVMGVINMAHGELIMLGAYTTYFIQQLLPNHIEISLLLAIPAAFCVSGFVGILIERSVIRHLYGRPLETLLATFGISLMLQQAVRTFVSSQNVAVINPSWMSGSWVVNPALSLTLNRLVIIGFCLLVFALLLLLFNRSGFGLQMRAVAQNRQMARAMGIRSNRIDALTFGLGSGIAGIAGVALSQLGNVGPNLGQSYIIDSFMVVVFGGVGNLWGTLVAGMTLGIANKFAEPWVGAVMAKVMILVFIILFIQRRPRGLFPQRGRAAES